ncbi:TonB-dependent receptor [Pseudohaliea rubra]|uniref:Ferrichrome-iron receptor n=1 Tax=Pseudohaliea rubra DSM 19751 TaxID=1265313 RepID=A0A095VM83_9GAMM|nr:TonB-dependent siderophore receptor [Pseudohaliea rubra]KGE02567.1 Ferrichrome-iron receptor [Pseudohaliea rubra DSM 19751]
MARKHALFLLAALPAALAFAQSEAPVLEEVLVTASGSQVELPPAYAGGQVARGWRAGLLGNLDYLEAPFSATAYTESLIHGQQAESVGDVLENDPMVRTAKGFGNFQEVYIVRGFPVFSDDLTLNGLYGVLPRQFVAAELLERVEVFRGANAFLNGAAPGGSAVGGTVNLVPKRAPEDGIRRVTLGFTGEDQLDAAVDLGQRFGAAREWGVRVNAMTREGEGGIDGQEADLSVFSIGADYAGERLRFSADLGYQDNRIDAPRPQVTPFGAIPGEPDSADNFAQPWTFTEEEQLFGVIRGEWLVSEHVTAWAAVGGRSGEEANVLANPNSDGDGNLSAFRFDNTREDTVLSTDLGIAANFATGDIGHRLVLSASAVDLESKNAFSFSSFLDTFASNLYNPVAVTAPAPDFFTGGNLADPLTTEEVQNRSVAIADTLAFAGGSVLVTAGLRYQELETRSFDFNSGVELSGYDSDAVTPAAGVVWRVTEELSLYGNYAESLQPGAIAPASSGGTPVLNAGEVLDPFRGEQWELGVKVDRERFGFTAGVFTFTRPYAIVAGQLFTDAGEQLNSGAELSVFGEPSDGLRLVGGLTWLDAELEETAGGLNEGNRPIGIPEWQASLNAEWDVPGLTGFTVEGRAVYNGEQYVDEANSRELDAWTRIDLGLRYTLRLADRPLDLAARLQNATGEDYWASTGGFPGANYLILGAPRTLFLSAAYSF